MTLDLLTASGLTAAFSTLLSLIFILITPARKWFEAKSAESQQALMGVGILIIATVAVLLGCFGILSFVPCTVKGIGDYFIGVVFAAILGDRVSKGWFAAARYFSDRNDRARGFTDGPKGFGKLLG